MSFASLRLSKPILAGIRDAGFERPTEIQARAIPIVADGGDLIGLGQTGSGKTAAFGLPLLDRLVGGEPGLRALIVVPTRELCVQVAEHLRIYAGHTGLHVRTAFGGIPIGVQEAAIRRGVDVLVACPGRLLDHLQCGNLTLDAVEILVLDEADRMLDMGFMPQIRRILARLPAQRQNLMFSATMPAEIERLVREHLGDPKRVQVGERSQAAATICHRFDEVRAPDKLKVLERLLRGQQGRVLIFVKRKVRAEEVGNKLKRLNLPADSIHGDKSAESRHVVLRAFDRGKTRFLVATDVAARGIDVSAIELVVNFEMPMSVEDYIHRVGRTGRAGSAGEALSLITRLDKRLFNDILKHLDKTSSGATVIVDGKVVRAPDGTKRAEREPKVEREPRKDDRESRRDDRESRRGDRDSRKAEREPRRAEGKSRKADGRSRKPERKRSDAEREPSQRRDDRGRNGSDRVRRDAASDEVELSRKRDNGTSQGFGAGLDQPESSDRGRRRRRARPRS